MEKAIVSMHNYSLMHFIVGIYNIYPSQWQEVVVGICPRTERVNKTIEPTIESSSFAHLRI